MARQAHQMGRQGGASAWVSVALSAAAVVVVALGCRLASACDEEPLETVLESSRAVVMVDVPEPNEAMIEDWTRWMARLERILPEGATVRADSWTSTIEVCTSETSCWKPSRSYSGEGPEVVFQVVAKALRVPASSVTWLEGREVRSWTVQVASTPWWEAAHRVADELEGGEPFLRIGKSGRGAVLVREGADQWTYQVITGVYLKRDAATQDLELLRAEGRDGYVRRLSSRG